MEQEKKNKTVVYNKNNNKQNEKRAKIIGKVACNMKTANEPCRSLRGSASVLALAALCSPFTPVVMPPNYLHRSY